MSIAIRVSCAAVCVLVLTACEGSPPSPAATGKGTAAPTAASAPRGTCALGGSLKPLPLIAGLSEAEIVERGKRDGFPVRTVCRDGVSLDQTDDYVPGRVNLVVEKGQVLRANEE